MSRRSGRPSRRQSPARTARRCSPPSPGSPPGQGGAGPALLPGSRRPRDRRRARDEPGDRVVNGVPRAGQAGPRTEGGAVNALEDRLRDAYRAAAETVRPEEILPGAILTRPITPGAGPGAPGGPAGPVTDPGSDTAGGGRRRHHRGRRGGRAAAPGRSRPRPRQADRWPDNAGPAQHACVLRRAELVAAPVDVRGQRDDRSAGRADQPAVPRHRPRQRGDRDGRRSWSRPRRRKAAPQPCTGSAWPRTARRAP